LFAVYVKTTVYAIANSFYSLDYKKSELMLMRRATASVQVQRKFTLSVGRSLKSLKIH